MNSRVSIKKKDKNQSNLIIAKENKVSKNSKVTYQSNNKNIGHSYCKIKITKYQN
jgi:hypothetical protein